MNAELWTRPGPQPAARVLRRGRARERDGRGFASLPHAARGERRAAAAHDRGRRAALRAAGARARADEPGRSPGERGTTAPVGAGGGGARAARVRSADERAHAAARRLGLDRVVALAVAASRAREGGAAHALVALPVQFRTVGELLAARRVDAAVTVADDLPASVRRKTLFVGGFVCLFDPRHARLKLIAAGGKKAVTGGEGGERARVLRARARHRLVQR